LSPLDKSVRDSPLGDASVLDEIFGPVDDVLYGRSLDAHFPALDDSSLDLLPDDTDVDAILGPLDGASLNGLLLNDPTLDDARGPIDCWERSIRTGQKSS
jgi:hypothetical protein